MSRKVKMNIIALSICLLTFIGYQPVYSADRVADEQQITTYNSVTCPYCRASLTLYHTEPLTAWTYEKSDSCTVNGNDLCRKYYKRVVRNYYTCRECGKYTHINVEQQTKVEHNH